MREASDSVHRLWEALTDAVAREAEANLAHETAKLELLAAEAQARSDETMAKAEVEVAESELAQAEGVTMELTMEQRAEIDAMLARRREEEQVESPPAQVVPPRRALTLSEARAAVLAAKQRLLAAQQALATVTSDGEERVRRAEGAYGAARRARENAVEAFEHLTSAESPQP